MINISYEYYRDVYGGTAIDEANFNMVMNRTISVVNSYLIVDLFELDESKYNEADITRLKTAICAAAECTSSYLVPGSNESRMMLASESVAGMWSRTYSRADTDNSEDAMRKSTYAVIEDFLQGSQFIRIGYYISG